MGLNRWLAAGLARVALASVAILLLPGSAHAAFPGQNGRIVFSSAHDDPNPFGCNTDPNCNYELYTIEPDGSDLQRLTFTAEPESTPAWSPDGRRIAFVRGTLPLSHVWVMNADGTGQVELTAEPAQAAELDPSWSPDGTRVVYADHDGTEEHPFVPGIYVMNDDGSGKEQLHPAIGVADRYPAWSPDGTTIAWAGAFEAGGGIWTMNADGTGATQLTAGGRTFSGDPNWSPDGSHIVFFGDDDAFAVQIYRIGADGSAQTVLGPGRNPAWSPDGTQIAFQDREPFPQEIRTMQPDGSGAQPLTVGREPDWQPLPGPVRGDYKNAAQFCRAERDFLGEQEFRERYGGKPNAFGKCVSSS